jgi:hypothetical protein
MSERRRPEKWYELKAGKGCGMCANQGLEDSGWGVRFLQGGHADVFLWRSGRVRGAASAHPHRAQVRRRPVPGPSGAFDVLALRTIVG